jgi:hypothetical protein
LATEVNPPSTWRISASISAGKSIRRQVERFLNGAD